MTNPLLPILVILVAAAGMYAAFFIPGWEWAYSIAAPAALIGLVWLVAVLVGRAIRAVLRGKDTRPLALVDGSNVMHWREGQPQIETVREVVYALSDKGFRVGVMFDANAGYKLFDRYHHDREFAGLLSLQTDHVMVVPKGTQADPFLLNAARDIGARIVTNDRFRDWADDFPEVAEAGHLIRGGYRKGNLWLNLQDTAKSAA